MLTAEEALKFTKEGLTFNNDLECIEWKIRNAAHQKGRYAEYESTDRERLLEISQILTYLGYKSEVLLYPMDMAEYEGEVDLYTLEIRW